MLKKLANQEKDKKQKAALAKKKADEEAAKNRKLIEAKEK